MITIEKEKIAEMMFDILKKSDELTNLSMADKYIANKINEAINDTHCCESDSEQLQSEETGEEKQYWLDYASKQMSND